MERDEQIRMLLHPEKYSDEQMDKMLDETDIAVPDAEEAWKRLGVSKLDTKNSKLRRIAVMFVGVLMLSGIAYAAIHIFRSHEDGVKSQETVVSANTQRQSPNTQSPADSTLWKPVVYEDTELATILSEMASFYQVETIYRKEASKHIRLYFTWDKKSTIDGLIDTFNKFERIHITREDQKLIVE